GGRGGRRGQARASRAAAPPRQPSSDAVGEGQRCGLCLAHLHADDLVGPSCGHLFCVRCLQCHVLGADFCRQGARCPRCPADFTVEQVKFLVGERAYGARQADMVREDEALARRVAAGARLRCPRCGREEHDGVRPSAAENGAADQRFDELMAEQHWRRCPVCAAPSEKDCGCNFMQCCSSRCQGHTYWCYICGKQMREEDHYSHYPR
ncbi:unnamed protein product, partial [Prorocentrum cordatum]